MRSEHHLTTEQARADAVLAYQAARQQAEALGIPVAFCCDEIAVGDLHLCALADAMKLAAAADASLDDLMLLDRATWTVIEELPIITRAIVKKIRWVQRVRPRVFVRSGARARGPQVASRYCVRRSRRRERRRPGHVRRARSPGRSSDDPDPHRVASLSAPRAWSGARSVAGVSSVGLHVAEAEYASCHVVTPLSAISAAGA